MTGVCELDLNHFRIGLPLALRVGVEVDGVIISLAGGTLREMMEGRVGTRKNSKNQTASHAERLRLDFLIWLMEVLKVLSTAFRSQPSGVFAIGTETAWINLFICLF